MSLQQYSKRSGVKQIRLTRELPDEEAAAFAGHFMTSSHYDLLVEDDADVYKPDGEPLLKYRENAISAAAVKAAYNSFRDAAGESSNRGIAGGLVDPARMPGTDAERAAEVHKTRYTRIRADGTASKTSHANPVASGIVGFFDRNPRFPYCRQTAFNANEPEKFAKATALIKEVDHVFHEELPERWQAQRDMADQTTDAFLITGTCFSTITVNRNWRTAVHQDKGDLKAGFGVLTAMRSGTYAGGYLVFPKFRVAVNMRTRGVLLADVHEWHGNTEMIGRAGRWERISLVLYYRQNMTECGTPAEELERAKKRKPGMPIRGKP